MAKDNPSERTKIVIFSDAPNPHRIQSAINGFDLLGGTRIALESKQPEQDEDVLIIVFDHLREYR
jgi:hypothetical protein